MIAGVNGVGGAVVKMKQSTGSVAHLEYETLGSDCSGDGADRLSASD